jgi:hypothetical protein
VRNSIHWVPSVDMAVGELERIEVELLNCRRERWDCLGGLLWVINNASRVRINTLFFLLLGLGVLFI